MATNELPGYPGADANYVCPYCGAFDSTTCDKLPPAGVRQYTDKQIARAREVGCRVAYFVDHRQAVA